MHGRERGFREDKASHDSERRNCIQQTQKCPMNDRISVILNGGICIPTTTENVFSDSERRN